MLGRPNGGEPVLTNSLAGPWLNTSVFMLRTMATSSTMVAEVRQQFATLGPALAVAGELPPRAEQLGVPLDEREPLVLDVGLRDDLAVEFLQLGLVVEQFELARPAGHEQEDDVLRLGGEMRRFRRERKDTRCFGNTGCLRGVQVAAGHQRGEGNGTDAEAGFGEELSAGEVAEVGGGIMHGSVDPVFDFQIRDLAKVFGISSNEDGTRSECYARNQQVRAADSLQFFP